MRNYCRCLCLDASYQVTHLLTTFAAIRFDYRSLALLTTGLRLTTIDTNDDLD
jgi:hypothetical protein